MNVEITCMDRHTRMKMQSVFHLEKDLNIPIADYLKEDAKGRAAIINNLATGWAENHLIVEARML